LGKGGVGSLYAGVTSMGIQFFCYCWWELIVVKVKMSS